MAVSARLGRPRPVQTDDQKVVLVGCAMRLFRRRAGRAPLADWHVRLVNDHEDEHAYTLGLAETEDGQEGATLLLMCNRHEPDEQDVAAKMDTYCLVDEEQSTVYGGVLAVVLEDSLLTLRLSQTSAAALGLDRGELRLTLEVPPEQLGVLRAGLTRVLSYGNVAQRPDLALGG